MIPSKDSSSVAAKYIEALVGRQEDTEYNPSLHPILAMNGITKVYPNGFVANRKISFSLKAGEIHGLIGENGAGKSTLMKVLFGEISADEGEILYKNRLLKGHSPLEAIALGIGMVHQHFMLAPSLSVWENIFMGIEPSRFGLLQRKKALSLFEEQNEKYRFFLNPRAKVADLSVSSRQKIEILKALIRGAEVLILDEPTAVLTPQECVELFAQLEQIRRLGHSIIFISHKLQEVKDICSHITVLRSGSSCGTFATEGVSLKEISRLMVGRSIKENLDKKSGTAGAPVLEVSELKLPSFPLAKPLSFCLHSGEILGIAGVEGNGQAEVSDIICRKTTNYQGSARFLGEEIAGKNINVLRKMGFAYVPEDRMVYGAALEASISENVISEKYHSPPFSSKGFINPKAVLTEGQRIIEKFKVKCAGAFQEMAGLSGGNIQKVIVGREFASKPKLVLAGQPTRGIDVGAAEIVRESLLDLKSQGSAVLLISADLEELLQVSDRIAVFYNGEITALLPNDGQLTEEILGEYMLGIKKEAVGDRR